MTRQMGALRSALIAAGASEDKASKAAEETAGYENQFLKLESSLTVMIWMHGIMVPGLASLVLKAFL